MISFHFELVKFGVITTAPCWYTIWKTTNAIWFFIKVRPRLHERQKNTRFFVKTWNIWKNTHFLKKIAIFYKYLWFFSAQLAWICLLRKKLQLCKKTVWFLKKLCVFLKKTCVFLKKTCVFLKKRLFFWKNVCFSEKTCVFLKKRVFF